jgi:hypothetical protein
MKRTLHRPIQGLDVNRLDLLLFHPDAVPATDGIDKEKERSSYRLFAASGARVVRDLTNNLKANFPPFDRPRDTENRRGTQREFAKFYTSLATTIKLETHGWLAPERHGQLQDSLVRSETSGSW